MIPGNSMETALARLPHGQAFRFVDRLISLVPGVSGVNSPGKATSRFLKDIFLGIL
jgi:hypothetical protein